VRSYLDAELATALSGRNGYRNRTRVHTARDVRAIDARQDRLVVDCAFADVRVEIHS
jgi:hypothetical protein